METARYHSGRVRLKMMSGKKRIHSSRNIQPLHLTSNKIKSYNMFSNSINFFTIFLVAIILSQNVRNVISQQSDADKDIVKTFSDEFAWHDNEIPQFNHLDVIEISTDHCDVNSTREY